MGLNYANRKAYEKVYYLAHKSEYAKRDREWSSKNKKRRVAQTMKCRAKDPEKYRLRQEKWRKANQKWIQEYRESHREESKAILRRHYQNNKPAYFEKCLRRRALKAKATINLRGIKAWTREVKSKKTFICYFCEERKPSRELHIDHIIPLVEGGQHAIENLCTACSACNLSKGKKLVSDWFKAGQLLLGI